MTIDESRVLDAQTLEDGGGLEELLEAFLDPVRGLVGGRAYEWQIAQQAGDVLLDALVTWVDA